MKNNSPWPGASPFHTLQASSHSPGNVAQLQQEFGFYSKKKELQCQTENNLISRGNTGAFYKYVNKKLNCSNGIAPLKCDNGSLVFDDAEKATLLNKYFSSVFTHDNGVIDPTRLPNKSVPNISSLYVSPAMVQKYIRGLKANSSAGPDGLPAEFYKSTSRPVEFPLSVIFNVSLQTNEIPEIWKFASVTPIFKKGSPSNPANYRPICLTCISCKLLEVGVKEAILTHLLTHGLINTRRGRSRGGVPDSPRPLTHHSDQKPRATPALDRTPIERLDIVKTSEATRRAACMCRLRELGGPKGQWGVGEGRRPDTIKPVGTGRAEGRYQQASGDGESRRPDTNKPVRVGEGRRPDTIKPVGTGRAAGPIPTGQWGRLGPQARYQQASGVGEGRRPDTNKPVGMGRAAGPPSPLAYWYRAFGPLPPPLACWYRACGPPRPHWLDGIGPAALPISTGLLVSGLRPSPSPLT